MFIFNWLFDPKIFATIMFGLSVLSTIRFGIERDLYNCLYWLFAAGITFVVTFVKP